jgi:hypothetical protein
MLQSIQGYLSSQGSSLASFKLPMPTLRPSELDDELAAFCSSRAEMREFVQKTRTQFNAKQAQVYAKLEAVVIQGKGGMGASAAQLHFVNRKASRGKTFLMHCLVTQFRAEGDVVLVVGTTGLSIVHYDRGRTAHSAFGIPVKEV